MEMKSERRRRKRKKTAFQSERNVVLKLYLTNTIKRTSVHVKKIQNTFQNTGKVGQLECLCNFNFLYFNQRLGLELVKTCSYIRMRHCVPLYDIFLWCKYAERSEAKKKIFHYFHHSLPRDMSPCFTHKRKVTDRYFTLHNMSRGLEDSTTECVNGV